jgi:hypothetical protein
MALHVVLLINHLTHQKAAFVVAYQEIAHYPAEHGLIVDSLT